MASAQQQVISRIATVHMISVHEEEDGLVLDIPNVKPSKFWIPPITAKQEEVRQRCKTAIRLQGSATAERIQYARINTTKENPPQKYVLLTIPEANTFRYGTEKQTLDEYNQKMFPDIERAPLYIKPEEYAYEFERQFGALGVITISDFNRDATPTQTELKKARDAYRAWMLKRVNDINKNYARHGAAEATRQTLNIVNRLYRDGVIAALPPWATIEAGAGTQHKACANCRTILLPESATCSKCGAVHNWFLALELGLKTEADVPKSKRKEAGLEGPIEINSAPTAAPVPLTIPDNAAVAIVGPGGVQTLEYGDAPAPDTDDASFGGLGGGRDPEAVAEEIENIDEEPVRAPVRQRRR